MEKLVRSMGEHLHQVITLAEEIKKQLPELEARAAKASDKAAEHDRIVHRTEAKTRELHDAQEKYEKVVSEIRALKERL